MNNEHNMYASNHSSSIHSYSALPSLCKAVEDLRDNGDDYLVDENGLVSKIVLYSKTCLNFTQPRTEE